MVWNGGAYHIDAPPDPARVDDIAARIRAFPPSLHINVPFGLGLLVDRLAADPETRAAFFSRLEVIFFAGAAIDANLWARLHDAVAAGPHGPGGAPSVLSGYGSTEAGSTICVAHEPPGRPGEECCQYRRLGVYLRRVTGPAAGPPPPGLPGCGQVLAL